MDPLSDKTNDLVSLIPRRPTYQFFRKADTLRNLMDQLILKKEKQSSIECYYESLETQLKENFRLSVIEIHSKRNETISTLDSLTDSAISKIKHDCNKALESLSKIRNKLTYKSPEFDALINQMKIKLTEEDMEGHIGLVNQAESMLDSLHIEEPTANYHSIKLEASNINFKVSFSTDTTCKSTQTCSRKERGSLLLHENSPERSSISSVKNDTMIRKSGNLSFSGIYHHKEKNSRTKIKVYLPHSYTKFLVVSVSNHTTARQVVDEILSQISKKGNFYLEVRSEEVSFLLKPYDLISDVIAEDYDRSLIWLLVRDN